MLELVEESIKNGGDIETHEAEFKEISAEIELMKSRIAAIQQSQSAATDTQDRLSQIESIIDERKENHLQYDDSIVRQMIECIKVYPDGKLEIIFGGGYIIEEKLKV